MPDTTLTEADFKQILVDGLGELKSITQDAVQQLANEYSPRLLSLVTSDDPAGERDDILVNMKLSYAILGVKAESVAGQAVVGVLKVATNLAFKFATAALA